MSGSGAKRRRARSLGPVFFLSRVARAHCAESVWCRRTLRDALVDHWRKRAAVGRAIEGGARLAEDSVAGVDAALESAVCDCASSLLVTLKPEFAGALRRVDLDGQSVKAFAEEAGIAPNHAPVRLFRGRKALFEPLQRSRGACAEHGCLDCDCSRGKPSRDRTALRLARLEYHLCDFADGAKVRAIPT